MELQEALRRLAREGPERCALLWCAGAPAAGTPARGAPPTTAAAAEVTPPLTRSPPRREVGEGGLGLTVYSYAEVHEAVEATAAALAQILQRLQQQACIVPSTGTGTCARQPTSTCTCPRVGVCVEDSPWLPIVEAAVLVAGGVVVPVPLASQPTARAASMLAQAAVAVLVTPDHLAPRAETALHHWKAGEAGEAGGAPADPPEAPTQPAPRVVTLSQLAGKRPPKTTTKTATATTSVCMGCLSHVCFTSGSTGAPKGCAVRRSSLLSYAAAKNTALGVDGASVCFVASSLAFDPSLGDFVATWLAGGTVALAAQDTILMHLRACLAATRATHVVATPSLFRTLQGASGLPALEVVALGGEVMPQALLDQWASEVRLYNLYGVTECCVYQSWCRMAPSASTAGPDSDQQRFCIGTALDGVTLSCGEPVVAGRRGTLYELLVSGPQVGAGYAGSDHLTREAFFEHPQLGWTYRTGDLVRLGAAISGPGKPATTPDAIASTALAGSAAPQRLYLAGRRDRQVKLNGRRIDLAEVEGVLQGLYPTVLVEAVCAVAKPDRQILAWVVVGQQPGCRAEGPVGDARDAGPVMSELVRCGCALHLPAYMVPARVYVEDELPCTATGKVSRRTLLKHHAESRRLQLSAAGEGALTGWARAAADAWGKQLGLKLGANARGCSFPSLGGDSLAALAVVRALTDAWEGTKRQHQDAAAEAGSGLFGEGLTRLTPAELMGCPSLSAFVALLRAAFGDCDLPGCGPGGDAGPASGPRLSAHCRRDGTASVDPNAVDGDRHSDAVPTTLPLLHRTAATGSAALVRFALGLGLDNEEQGPAGRTALHFACGAGGLEAVSELLARGHAAGTPDARGITPLMLAMGRGGAALVRALVSAGANVRALDANRQSVLHHGARCGAAVRAFGACIDESRGARQGKGRRAAGLALAFSLDARDAWGRTALHWAVVNGHRSIVQCLMDEGASQRLADQQGETPLAIAERRARCGAERPAGLRPSVFGDIAKLLGGSGKTRNVRDRR